MFGTEDMLFPPITEVAVQSVDVNDETIRIEVGSTAAGAACPGCRSQIHSSYLQVPQA